MAIPYGGFKIFENKVDEESIYRIAENIYVPPKLLDILKKAMAARESIEHLRDRKNRVSRSDNYFDNLSERIGIPEIDEFLRKEEFNV
jgi:hypothetical protein